MIGLDVHQNKISACAIAEQADGTVTVEHCEFGGFKRDREALAQWASAFAPEVVVMESTGIYWKSPYAALEKVGLVAWVVNARHVKTVPGRKTDVADAQWLAALARAGLDVLAILDTYLLIMYSNTYISGDAHGRDYLHHCSCKPRQRNG